MSLKTKAFVGFIAAITLFQAGLGVWQWRRLGEKQAFIAAMEAGAAAAPKPFSEARIWQRVEITGRFLHSKTAYVRSSKPEPKPGERNAQGQVPASGFGVLVMTPFVTRLCTAEGRCRLATIYVNRGFLPTAMNGKIPAFDRPENTVTLVGFLRPSETPGLFQPGNDASRGNYFHRSIEEMAKAADLFGANVSEGSPYDRFIDRQAQPGETTPPHGVNIREFLAAIPNNHYQYALTWWALALTNIIVMAFFLASRRKRTAETR